MPWEEIHHRVCCGLFTLLTLPLFARHRDVLCLNGSRVGSASPFSASEDNLRRCHNNILSPGPPELEGRKPRGTGRT